MTLIVDFILFLFSLLPNPLAVAYGRFIGFLLKTFNFKKKLILRHIEIAYPDMSESECLELYSKVCRHFGLLIVEILRLPYFKRLKTAKRVNVIGFEENFKPLLEKGGGFSLLAGHIGNWEMMGVYIAAVLGQNVNPIVKEMRGDLGNYLLKRIRLDNGLTTLPRRNAMRQILKAMKNGGCVTHIIDQNMTSDEGIFVNFFGKPACTQSGLSIITRKTKTPVVPLVFYRNDDLKSFTLEFLPPVAWEEGEGENQLNTQKYTSVIEDLIRRKPDQWIWMHKRWKTQPE